MEFSSSLKFRHRLRESSSPLEAVCYLEHEGTVVTVDENALRKWSFRRQEKTVFWRSAWRRVILDLKYMRAHRVMILVAANRNEEGAWTGLTMQVWSTDLRKIQQIALPYSKVLRVVWSPDQTRLILVSRSLHFTFLKIEATMVETAAGAGVPLFPKERDMRGSAGDNAIAEGSAELSVTQGNTSGVRQDQDQDVREDKEVHYSLEEYQNTDNSEVLGAKREYFQEVHWTDKDQVIMLVSSYVHWYFKEFMPEGPKMSSKALRLAKLGLAPPPDKIPRPKEPPFRLIRSLDFNDCSPDDGAEPRCLQRVGLDCFVVGFNNGAVKVILCNLSSAEHHENTPRVVTSFQAHDASISSVRLCPWRSALGGAAVTEILVTGLDHKVSHWEICLANEAAGGSTAFALTERGQTPIDDADNTENAGDADEHEQRSTESTAQVLVENLLGEYRLVAEPPNSSMFGDYLNRVTQLGLGIMYLSTSGTVPRRIVNLVYGGQLVVLEISARMRRRALRRGVVHTALGPFMGEAFKYRAEGSVDEATNSFLALSDGHVTMVSSLEGEELKKVDSLARMDSSQTLEGLSAMTRASVTAQNKAAADAYDWLEGYPTCMYWCPLSQYLFIGYSSGGVSLQAPGVVFIEPTMTRKVHGNKVTAMLTFMPTSASGKKLKNPPVFLLIGDDNGMLSSWQMLPTVKEDPTWTSQSHSAPVNALDSVSLSSVGLRSSSLSGGGIVVSSCRSGTVRAWGINSDGTLGMVAFFDTKTTLTALGVVAFRRVRGGKELGTTLEGGSTTLLDASLSQLSMDETMLKSQSLVETSQLDALQSLASVNDAGKDGRAGLSVVCLCGSSEGLMQSWALTKKEEALSYPKASGLVHGLKITAIRTTIRKRDANVLAVSSSLDGTVLVSQLDPNGLLMRLQYFELGFSVQNVFLQMPSHEQELIEAVAFGEQDMARVLLVDSGGSSQWVRRAEDIRKELEADLGRTPFMSSFSVSIDRIPGWRALLWQ